MLLSRSLASFPLRALPSFSLSLSPLSLSLAQANHWIHLFNYEIPQLWGCIGSFS